MEVSAELRRSDGIGDYFCPSGTTEQAFCLRMQTGSSLGTLVFSTIRDGG
jgi:hypothetical protein